MFKGSIVALVTPMTDDGRVDYAALDALVDWHLAEGTDGIVAVGTTGESATLDVDEHLDVIRRVVTRVAKRIPVIAGTGGNSTREAIDLTRDAKTIGADACLSVTPYYNKPPQEGLYRHFKMIAETVDLPVILYNVPGRTGCDMQPETVIRLSKIPGIIGLKEAKGELGRIRELIEGLPKNFAVYTGDDATARESILLGCAGDISVTANIAPRLMHEMCAAALAGEADKAAQIDAQIAILHHKLFIEPNPIPAKWALAQMGRIPAGIRLPLVPLDSRYHDELRQALSSAGVL